jgi:hypothetical protein
MKTNHQKKHLMHKINKSSIDPVSANNKTHHNSPALPTKKTAIKNKDIFSLNYCYDNFFTKLIH